MPIAKRVQRTLDEIAAAIRHSNAGTGPGRSRRSRVLKSKVGVIGAVRDKLVAPHAGREAAAELSAPPGLGTLLN